MRFYFFAFLISLSTIKADTSSSRPNIIIIYTDDHGWPDVGPAGIHKDLKTPHLDALASSGVRCTDGYSSAPQCVPSRAGLMTGKYQNRINVPSNSSDLTTFNKELTVAEHLKKAGCRLGGMSGPRMLRQMGLDTFMLTQDVVTCLQGAGLEIAPVPTNKSDLAKIQQCFNEWHEKTGYSFNRLSRICASSVGENYTPS